MKIQSSLYYLGLSCFPVCILSLFNIFYSYYFDYLLDVNSYIIVLFLSFLIGSFLCFIGKTKKEDIDIYSQLILIFLIYLLISILISIPFHLSIYQLSLIDSFFESVSGFSNTGFSVISDIKNLDLIGSHVNLSGLEVETANESNRAFLLKDILNLQKDGLLKKYDNIFIDCPPSLSLLTIMALVASDELLVPLQTEFFALEGITQLVKTIDRIKENLNPSLTIRGILLTMFDKRNKLSSEVDREARNYFKEKVYQTVIQRNVRLSEAPSHGLPCVVYDKNCVGSKSYFKLAEEFLKKNQIESAA